MKSKWLMVFNFCWLIFVMPVLGLIPFSLLTGLIDADSQNGRLAVSLLRSVRGLVLPDPSPQFSHTAFYELAPPSVWWVVVVAVFSVSVWSLYYWWRRYARR